MPAPRSAGWSVRSGRSCAWRTLRSSTTSWRIPMRPSCSGWLPRGGSAGSRGSIYGLVTQHSTAKGQRVPSGGRASGVFCRRSSSQGRVLGGRIGVSRGSVSTCRTRSRTWHVPKPAAARLDRRGMSRGASGLVRCWTRLAGALRTWRRVPARGGPVLDHR